ncbi:MAG: M20/M25/M40 family metallo-hydrolase [Ardenticatenaceae bacterium]|nr:M20/M25/M40 family metallo-hydrolase [Ardenticatenaceae bacterium]HBY94030.1 hypothetical protein [Chloroflexota bacterium]
MLDPTILQQMTSFNAVSGNEEPFARWLAAELEPFATRVEIDPLGNLIAWKGESPRRALFSHMDSVGFMVQEARPGAIKLVKIGGPETPAHTRLVVETTEGPLEGILLVEDNTLYLDLGLASLEKVVRVGDVVAFAPNFRQQGEMIISRHLDNKLACWIALEAFKQAESMIFVSTVREEHPPAGAGSVAARLDIDLAVTLDITYADSLSVSYPIKLDGGPAVTLLDRMLHDRRWAKRMMRVAEANSIPSQVEVVTGGGSDAFHIAQAGVPTVFLGVPIRYAHTPNELTFLEDSRWTLALIQAFWHEQQ